MSITLNAIVIVDPPSLGGDITVLIDGNKYAVRGSLARGLRAAAKAKHEKLSRAGYTTGYED